jgi:hypothetical protein
LALQPLAAADDDDDDTKVGRQFSIVCQGGKEREKKKEKSRKRVSQTEEKVQVK